MTPRDNQEHLKNRLQELSKRRDKTRKDLDYMDSVRSRLAQYDEYSDSSAEHQKRFVENWKDKIRKGHALTEYDKLNIAKFIIDEAQHLDWCRSQIKKREQTEKDMKCVKETGMGMLWFCLFAATIGVICGVFS